MGPLWLELLALCVCAPALGIVRALGQAVAARAGGVRITAIGLGAGPTLWRTSLASGRVVHLGALFLVGATVDAIPIRANPPRRAWFHAGGLLAQGSLALLLLALPGGWWLERLLMLNLCVGALQGVPWKVGVRASDGWLVWRALWSRQPCAAPSDRAWLQGALVRAETLGSPVARAYARVCLAWVDVRNGQGQEALEGLLELDETGEPWVDALKHYVLAELHRVERRPLAALRVAREASLRPDLPSDEAMALIALAEARALVDLDSGERAQTVLARAVGTSGPVGHQASVVWLYTALDGPTEALEQGVERIVRHLERPWLDPADVAVCLWEAGLELEERGRSSAASSAHQSARQLGRSVLDAASPPQRPGVRGRLGPAAGMQVFGTSMIG